MVLLCMQSREMVVSTSTEHPNSAWVVKQTDRFVDQTMDREEKPSLVMDDLDAKFTKEFVERLKARGVRHNALPKASPNLNGYVACCTSLVRLGRTSGNRRRSDSFLPLAFGGGCLIEWIEQTFVFVIVKVAKQQSMTAPDLDGSCCHLELLRDFGEG